MKSIGRLIETNSGKIDLEQGGRSEVYAWKEVFGRARGIVDAPTKPPITRDFWRAILECRTEDTVHIFENKMGQEAKSLWY